MKYQENSTFTITMNEAERRELVNQLAQAIVALDTDEAYNGILRELGDLLTYGRELDDFVVNKLKPARFRRVRE